MTWLLFLIFNLAIIIINPSGLLLVVSHLFAFAILILWVGVENKIDIHVNKFKPPNLATQWFKTLKKFRPIICNPILLNIEKSSSFFTFTLM